MHEPKANDTVAETTRELLQRLARVRESKGMTQAQVAERMGTSQPYIARLEKAVSDPRLSTVLKYATIVLGGVLVARLLRDLERSDGGE